MSHKIFDNNLVMIRKGNLALKLNKPAYTGMCILEYGKTMENLRNRIHVKLVNKMSHKIFDNNLVMIRKGNLVLKLNKPAYIGMCILELSKVLINKFHCDYIKNKYENK